MVTDGVRQGAIHLAAQIVGIFDFPEVTFNLEGWSPEAKRAFIMSLLSDTKAKGDESLIGLPLHGGAWPKTL